MKLHLVRVRLNSGGYDTRGRYWGVGTPLYAYWSDDDGYQDYHGHVRAATRNEAKRLIALELTFNSSGKFLFSGPTLTFYR